MACLPAPGVDEGAVEGGEEPGFDPAPVLDLIGLAREPGEDVLGHVAGIRLGPGQGEGKAVERFVVGVHNFLKRGVVRG